MSVINAEALQVYMEELEELVTELMFRLEQLGLNEEAKPFQPTFAAVDRLFDAYSALWSEFEHLQGGQSHDTARFDELADETVKWIVVVDLYLERWELAKEALAELTAQMTFEFVEKFLKRLLKVARELQGKLKKLKQELKEARDDVKEAEWQRRINGVLGAIGLFLGPVGSLVTGVASIATDAFLGPDKFDATGTALNATSTAIDAIDKLDEVSKKLVGAAGLVYSYKSDTDEINKAKRIASRLEKEVNALLKVKQRLHDILKHGLPKLQSFRKLALRAQRRYRHAVKEIHWVERYIDELKKQLPPRPTASLQGIRHQWGAVALHGTHTRNSTAALAPLAGRTVARSGTTFYLHRDAGEVARVQRGREGV